MSESFLDELRFYRILNIFLKIHMHLQIYQIYYKQ